MITNCKLFLSQCVRTLSFTFIKLSQYKNSIAHTLILAVNIRDGELNKNDMTHDELAILQLWMETRLRVTLFWYKPSLLCYANCSWKMLVSIRITWFTQQGREVCIKTRSPSASLPSTTVKWPIVFNEISRCTFLKENCLTHTNKQTTTTTTTTKKRSNSVLCVYIEL